MNIKISKMQTFSRKVLEFEIERLEQYQIGGVVVGIIGIFLTFVLLGVM